MKRILYFLVLILILSCEKEQQYSGEIDISGYCYDPCDGSPLVNYIVKYRHEEIVFETYTNVDGYFELKETYSFLYEPRNPPDESGYIYCSDTANSYHNCNSIRISNLSEFNRDTIFFNQTVKSVFTIKIDPNVISSNMDTVFFKINDEVCGGTARPVYRSNTTYYSISYNKYYVGPFQDNQVLDTVQTWIAPSVRKSATTHSTSTWIVRGDSLNIGSSFLDGYFVSGSAGNTSCNSFQYIELNLNE